MARDLNTKEYQCSETSLRMYCNCSNQGCSGQRPGYR